LSPYWLWTERLLGLALVLQTLELLQLRRAYADTGVWSFTVLRDELSTLPWLLRAPLQALFPYRRFIAILWLRLPLSVSLLAGQRWAALPLLLSQLLVCARFRGTFNGGSDYMTVVVLLATSLAACFPGSTLIQTACLAYICAQLVLSYFIAGVVKLAKPEWRTGGALSRLVASGRYGAPSPFATVLARPAVARAASVCVLSFECLFPAVLLAPRLAAPAAVLGLAFHLTNAYVFGLNRFLFAWAAAYPALLYFCATLGRNA
jgi:hypothetical protein